MMVFRYQGLATAKDQNLVSLASQATETGALAHSPLCSSFTANPDILVAGHRLPKLYKDM